MKGTTLLQPHARVNIYAVKHASHCKMASLSFTLGPISGACFLVLKKPGIRNISGADRGVVVQGSVRGGSSLWI